MMNADPTSVFESKSRLGIVMFLAMVALVLPHVPVLHLFTLPLYSFTTTIHECGHAIACLLTGGQVVGMSIVNDGEGHGGLTYCRGGMPLIYTQAGYISTALMGSLLIYLGRFHRLSKIILFLLGAAFGAASLTFMLGTILAGSVLAGLMSMCVGLIMGAGLMFFAVKSTPYWANIVLLFLGVQTGLNALNDDGILIAQAFGQIPGTWSDATNMQSLTLVPAPVWAALWTLIAFALLYQTLRSSYKLNKRKRALKTI